MTNKKRTSHTPGPWEWWTSNSYRRLSGPDGKDGGVLHATVLRDGQPDVVCRDADRALIAAAPNLLATLKEIHEPCDAEPGDCHICGTIAEAEDFANV